MNLFNCLAYHYFLKTKYKDELTMSIGFLIVNPLLQQYKSLGTYGIFKKSFVSSLKTMEKESIV